MSTDDFTLYDADGREILSRKMAEHIHLAIDEQGLLEGDNADKVYTVISDVSGYELRVDQNTTAEEWRSYADRCLLALD